MTNGLSPSDWRTPCDRCGRAARSEDEAIALWLFHGHEGALVATCPDCLTVAEYLTAADPFKRSMAVGVLRAVYLGEKLNPP